MKYIIEATNDKDVNKATWVDVTDSPEHVRLVHRFLRWRIINEEDILYKKE